MSEKRREKRHISEAAYERMVDAIVRGRLTVDRAYLNAANADEQAQREDEIEEQTIRELEADYIVD
jgi:hypothetical protein